MPDLPLDPVQILALRALLGVPDGEPDPTPDDLAVVLAAEQVIDAVAPSWWGRRGEP
jgi:hypothetical protein